MIRAIFTEEYRGVTDVICDHVEFVDMQILTNVAPRELTVFTVARIHFTITISWDVRTDLIKRIEAAV